MVNEKVKDEEVNEGNNDDYQEYVSFAIQFIYLNKMTIVI